jgi:hypothetical protein
MAVSGDYADLPSGAGNNFVVHIGEGATAELATCTRSGTTLTFAVGLTYAHAAAEEVQGPILASDVLENFAQLDSINNFTAQQKFTGSSSSLGVYYPDIIFDATETRTGILGSNGEVSLVVYSGGLQVIALQATATSVGFGAPATFSVPYNFSGTHHDGSSVSNPYVPNPFGEAGYIACFPTTAAAQLDITLPDPYNSSGMVYLIADQEDGAAANNIVVSCADDFTLGTTVEGGASYTINTNGRSVMLRAEFNADYSNANWKVIAHNG